MNEIQEIGETSLETELGDDEMTLLNLGEIEKEMTVERDLRRSQSYEAILR